MTILQTILTLAGLPAHQRVHLTELGREKRDGGAHRVRVERDDCSGRFATRPSDLRQDVTSAFQIPSCSSR